MFGFDHDEIAEAVGKSAPAVRQVAHRAREHVRAESPRMPVDRATHEAVTRQFFAAAMSGSTDGLLALMAPDVVLLTDGGGVKQAALRPIHGADKIIRWLWGVSAQSGADARVEFAEINGRLGILAYNGAELDSVFMLDVDGGLIRAVYAIRNPEKLHAIG